MLLTPKGPFTVSVSVSVCGDANKSVQLTSMMLFTLNDAKHQRKKTQTLALTLTVNRPLVCDQHLDYSSVLPPKSSCLVI